MWYSVYRVSDGELVSVASSIPSDDLLQSKGLWYITTAKSPDFSKVIWDKTQLTYVPRPPDPEAPPLTSNELEAIRLWKLDTFTQADAASALRLIFRIVISKLIQLDLDWK